MKNLQRGDIIRSKTGHRTFMVTSNYGNRVTAVATVDVTQASEWDLCLKADHKKPGS